MNLIYINDSKEPESASSDSDERDPFAVGAGAKQVEQPLGSDPLQEHNNGVRRAEEPRKKTKPK